MRSSPLAGEFGGERFLAAVQHDAGDAMDTGAHLGPPSSRIIEWAADLRFDQTTPRRAAVFVQRRVFVLGPLDDLNEIRMLDRCDEVVATITGIVRVDQHPGEPVGHEVVAPDAELLPDQNRVAVHLPHQRELFFEGIDRRRTLSELRRPVDDGRAVERLKRRTRAACTKLMATCLLAFGGQRQLDASTPIRTTGTARPGIARSTGQGAR